MVMFDHFAFFLRKMGILMASLLVKSFIILGAFQLQGSAGDDFSLLSL